MGRGSGGRERAGDSVERIAIGRTRVSLRIVSDSRISTGCSGGRDATSPAGLNSGCAFAWVAIVGRAACLSEVIYRRRGTEVKLNNEVR